ncbi:MAG: prolyl-tRNA synthetase associated domain-containing protein [Alphaproteobacteria bacterium]|jgi:Ala-tRNA(Pro) deacylase|nr:prolyl-tRNA synthetase associated domain-containing protein [Alphaproteobacteria bacterium]
MKQLEILLKELNIEHDKYEHEALHTIEDVKKCEKTFDGLFCKNMFLKDKKGEYFLFCTPAEKAINQNTLQKQIGSKRLSFASADRLKEVLDLTPGSVCPFGIMNDDNNLVKVVIDCELIGQEKILFHPMINTSTISISYDDLIKFITHCGNEHMVVEV